MDDRRFEELRAELLRLIKLQGHAAALAHVRGLGFADEDPRLRLEEAVLLADLGRHEEATPILEAMLPSFPRDPRLRLYLARSQHAVGKPERALRHVEAIDRRDVPGAEPVILRAEILAGLGREGEALELIETEIRAIEGAEENGRSRAQLDESEAELRVAQAHHLRLLRRPDEAAVVARGVLERWPGHANAGAIYGLSLIDRGLAAEAIGPLRSAFSQRPGNREWGLHLAQALMATRDLTLARDVLEQVLESHRDDAAAHERLSAIALSEGETEEAREHARRVISLEPAKAAGWVALAMAEQVAGRSEAAREAIREALARPPVTPLAQRLATALGL